MKTEEASILIIDDDEDVLFSAKMLLKDYYKKIKTVSEPHSIPHLISNGDYEMILLDMNYSGSQTSGKEGLRWLREIKELDPEAIVIMMTAYGTLDLAVQAIREGATDFVIKPWQNQKLLSTLSSAYNLGKAGKKNERLRNNSEQSTEKTDKHFGEFIGESSSMRNLYSVISKTAATDANILILGENGTGKELVARAIHKQSLRAKGNMVSVDLGSINENLFESELFGHVKGAFTDAKEDRAGRFEIATGGTLFLDEIGNIPLTLQAKLLAALQNRQISRLGSNKIIPVDLRLISATNMPIYEMAEKGDFREDLLYRVKTIEIHLPPLRERDGDILLLAEHFVNMYCKKYRKIPMKISQETKMRLESYYWPGNVRELQHVVERAVILAEGRILKPGDFSLKDYIRKQQPEDLTDLDTLTAVTVKKVLEKNHGNITRAAKELGITRSALYRRIEKYGI